MKKSLLVSVSMLFLLTACGGGETSSSSSNEVVSSSSSSSEVVSSSESSSSSESVSSESISSEVSSSEASSESSSSNESSSSSEEASSSSSEKVEVKTEVSFYPCNEDAGYRYADHVDVFDGYFPEGFLASSSTITNTNAQKYESTNESDTKLTMGSGSGEGSITLYLTTAVDALIIKGSDYYNHYSYTGNEGYSYGEANVTVNGSSQQFTHVAEYGETPASSELHYDFATPTSEITISTSETGDTTYSGNRCFVEALTFIA